MCSALTYDDVFQPAQSLPSSERTSAAAASQATWRSLRNSARLFSSAAKLDVAGQR